MNIARHMNEHAQLGLQKNSGRYLWANRPAAAGRTGDIIYITDIGPNGAGSYWYSDGARWRLVNNASVINQQTAEYVLTGTLSEVLIAQQKIPAGSMKNFDYLAATVAYARPSSGQSSTVTIRYRLGTNPAALTDPVVFTPTAIGAVNTSGAMKFELDRLAPTSVRLRQSGSLSTPLTWQSSLAFPSAVTVPDMDASDVYMSLTGQILSVVGDSLTLKAGTLELLTCGS